MAEKILIVVDVQNDFVTGSLGTPEAVKIVPHVVDRVKHFDGTVLFTRDTHEEDYPDTQEGTLLPVKHCIRGTEGWQLVPELDKLCQENEYKVYDKVTFGSVELAKELLSIHESKGIASIELLGLCTDICVVSNALLLKAYMPEVPIFVDEEGCAGVTPEKHDAAIEVMASCQIIVQ